MYIAAPKTSFEITAEANCLEWDDFSLQLQKKSKNGRFLPKK